MVIEKKKSQKKRTLKKDKTFRLYLMNDELNTFDYVVDCLIHIFEFTEEQALQVTLITHLKGSCLLKKADYDVLSYFQQELAACSIQSKIV
jgi:ATP-dependent Clp protease adaptor protein ClpS